MKDKLQKIRETLDFYATCKSQNSWEEFWKDIKDDGKSAQNGLDILDTLIAELDSEELIEKIAAAINDSHPDKLYTWEQLLSRNAGDEVYRPQQRFIRITRKAAKVLINTIKGL